MSDSGFLWLISLCSSGASRKDQPSFTLRQVSYLCERLLKDHEEKIREEYEQILNTKLAGKLKSLIPLSHLAFRFCVTAICINILATVVSSLQNNMNLLWNSHKTRSCEDTAPGLLVVCIFFLGTCTVYFWEDSLVFIIHISLIPSCVSDVSWTCVDEIPALSHKMAALLLLLLPLDFCFISYIPPTPHLNLFGCHGLTHF